MKLLENYGYVVVEGNIGAGKTALVNKLAIDSGVVPVLEEFAEISFLSRFYKDPGKYAFQLELSFLAARFKQLNQRLNTEKNQLILADYHIRKSLLFAQFNLKPEELAVFESFYEIASSQIPEPDLVIYLEKGVGKLRSNILSRGREYEKNISESYLSGIQNSYYSLLNIQPFKKLIIIPSDSLDFVNNEKDYHLIINMLNSSKDAH